MENLTYRVIITKDSEGGYLADVPSLNHCISYGDSIEEAIENVKEAIDGVLETMVAHNLPIPNDENSMEISLNIHHNYSYSHSLISA